MDENGLLKGTNDSKTIIYLNVKLEKSSFVLRNDSLVFALVVCILERFLGASEQFLVLGNLVSLRDLLVAMLHQPLQEAHHTRVKSVTEHALLTVGLVAITDVANLHFIHFR